MPVGLSVSAVGRAVREQQAERVTKLLKLTEVGQRFSRGRRTTVLKPESVLAKVVFQAIGHVSGIIVKSCRGVAIFRAGTSGPFSLRAVDPVEQTVPIGPPLPDLR